MFLLLVAAEAFVIPLRNRSASFFPPHRRFRTGLTGLLTFSVLLAFTTALRGADVREGKTAKATKPEEVQSALTGSLDHLAFTGAPMAGRRSDVGGWRRATGSCRERATGTQCLGCSSHARRTDCSSRTGKPQRRTK